jgi:quinol monooxygenase YgiN
MAHVLLNRLTAMPGKRDLVVRNLIESGQVFDDNPDCLLYLVAGSAGSPDDIWVVDLWTTERAHTEALQDPELQPFIAETMPLLEGMPEQIEIRARGGKGVSAAASLPDGASDPKAR